MYDQIVTEQLCIYCFKGESNKTPYCPENPGALCQYGLGHEYPITKDDKPKQPVKRADKNVCAKCGLHARNPASATNGCPHEYPQ